MRAGMARKGASSKKLGEAEGAGGEEDANMSRQGSSHGTEGNTRGHQGPRRRATLNRLRMAASEGACCRPAEAGAAASRMAESGMMVGHDAAVCGGRQRGCSENPCADAPGTSTISRPFFAVWAEAAQ